MRPTAIAAALLLAAMPAVAPDTAPALAEHVAIQAGALHWEPIPPAYPPGAQVALLAGNPEHDGPYVLRVKVPAGYKVPPHTHPTDENVTVISGTFHLGMGERLDTRKGQAVRAGGFVLVARDTPHYAWFTSPTVFQVHGIGPFAISYVNPADDPRNASAQQ